MSDPVDERIRRINAQAVEGKISREEAARRVENLKNEHTPQPETTTGWGKIKIKMPWGRS